METLVKKCRNMILPFVFVAIVRFVMECMAMKVYISKPKMDILYYLMNDIKVRRIRESVIFILCIPSYYAFYCLCSGYFYFNDIFIIVFGLLCFIGVFGETFILQLFAGVGLFSSIAQFVYVKIKERESLEYI